MRTPLVVVEILAACIWVGSLVCLAVVSGVARSVLDGPAQLAFFRGVGKRYAFLGTASLIAAIAAGLALAGPPSTWSGTLDAAVALAGVLVLATAAGMCQAHAMTLLRRRAVASPGDGATVVAIRRGRRLASTLRSLMAGVTLALVVLAATLAH